MADELLVQLALLIGAAVLVAMILVQHRVGIALLILLLPFSSSQLIPRQMFGVVGLNPLNLLLLISMVAWCFSCVRQGTSLRFPKFRPLLWAYVLPFVVAGAIGVGRADEISSFLVEHLWADGDASGVTGTRGYLLTIVLKPLILILAAYFIAMSVSAAKEPERMLIPVFSAAAIFSIVITAYVLTTGIGLHVLSQASARGTLSWVGMHANEQGLLLNLAFALTLFTATSVRVQIAKASLWFVAVLITVAVALTFSRGAYLGYLVVVAHFAFSRRGLKKVFALTVGAIAAVVLVPDELVSRITYGFSDLDVEAISAGRVENIWTPLLPYVFDNLFLGSGLSSIMWSPPMKSGSMLPVGHPHSAYLGLVMDMGLLGAALVTYFWFRAWRLFSALQQAFVGEAWSGFFKGASVCVVVVLVQGLTDDRFTPTYPQVFLWLALGFAIGLLNRLRAREASIYLKATGARPA